MKYILLLIFVTVHAFFVSAQSVKDELIKINEAYQKKNDLFMQIEYGVYYRDSKKLIEVQRGVVSKTSSSLYQKLGNTETFSQDSLQVVMDHQRKTMVLMPKVTSANNLLVLAKDLETTLARCSTITEVDLKGFKGYEMVVNDEGYYKIYFTYSPKNYMLHQIIFFYKSMMIDGQHLDNVNVEMNHTYTGEDKKRSLYDFIKKINGRYEISDTFSVYQFMDYTSVTVKK